jgi:hypothetical protein
MCVNISSNEGKYFFKGKSLMVISLTIVSHYDYVFFMMLIIILNALSYFKSSKSLLGVFIYIKFWGLRMEI